MLSTKAEMITEINTIIVYKTKIVALGLIFKLLAILLNASPILPIIPKAPKPPTTINKPNNKINVSKSKDLTASLVTSFLSCFVLISFLIILLIFY